MKKALCLIALCAVALAVDALCQEKGPGEKTAQLFSFIRGGEVPGAAVAVVSDGRTVFLASYGAASLEQKTLLTEKSLFDAGSLAKQFTAFAVLLLREEGKLGLDDEVRKHLPEFPDFGTSLRIRHLLYHQGGLRDWGGLVQLAGGRIEDPIGNATVMRLLRNQRELNFRPGTEFLYCNAGYIVLAEIAARASGMPFAQYAREKIFRPLGMEDSRFVTKAGEVMLAGADSYAFGGDGSLVRQQSNAAVSGPGGLFVSIADLAKWLENLQTRRLGSPALWETMLQAVSLEDGTPRDYAAGLIRGEYRDLQTWSHSGGWAGFRSDLLWFPRERFGVVLLANQTHIDVSRLARSVADIWLEKSLAQAPAARQASPPSPEVLDSSPGKYRLYGDQLLTIEKSDGGLAFRAGTGPLLPLQPLGERLFAFVPARIRIEFPRETENGMPRKLFFWRGDYCYRADRLAAGAWSPGNPAEFGGIYYSPELQSAHRIYVREGKLFLASLRRGDLELVPLDRDSFGGSGSSLGAVFARDGSGRIAGVLLSFPEARNVRFEKVSDGSR